MPVSRKRLAIVSLLCAAVVAGSTVPARADEPDVRQLERQAYELDSTAPQGRFGDLRPLGRMVGDAKVAGFGEATHSSHEFFTMKHRIFRYLVERKAFRAFSLEIAWSTGLRIDDYVVHGRGDIHQILQEDGVWNTAEYLDLVRWMRTYNTRHEEKLRFTGNDIGYPGTELFTELTHYAQRYQPELLPRLDRLYSSVKPATTDSETWTNAYIQRPLAEREDIARQAKTVLDDLQHRHGSDRRAHEWAVQHARVLSQSTTLLGFNFEDPHEIPRSMRYRDQAMAENTAWWHEHTGQKVMLSAHNAHVGYVSDNPQNYPKMQGAFLRDRFGDDYRTVGFTFHHGSFNARDENDEWRTVTVGAPNPAGNEHTLDKVKYRDFLLDTRAKHPAIKGWLNQPRATRSIGLGYPEPEYQTALGKAYDGVIHLHEISRAELLPGPRYPARP